MSHLLRALALGAALAFAAPAAMAQAPVNPTAEAVSEDALLNALAGDQAVAGRISIPDPKAADLIKPFGPEWRATHQTLIWWLSVGAVGGMLVVLVVFYLTRGRIRIDAGLAGVTVTRFNAFERFTHWMTATCFLVLAFTGLNLIVGRHLLLPLIGAEAFTAVSQLGKLGHNYLALPFAVGVALMFLIWVKDNIPGRHDAAWLAAGGGLFGGDHPPAPRFNAGQKLIFWSVVIGGAALSVTGFLLMFPYLTGGPAQWQLMQLIHGAVAAVLIAVMIAHIYIGSVGMEGAFDAMGSGEVDLSWAREHHGLWVEQLRGGGARGSAAPAE